MLCVPWKTRAKGTREYEFNEHVVIYSILYYFVHTLFMSLRSESRKVRPRYRRPTYEFTRGGRSSKNGLLDAKN